MLLIVFVLFVFTTLISCVYRRSNETKDIPKSIEDSQSPNEPRVRLMSQNPFETLWAVRDPSDSGALDIRNESKLDIIDDSDLKSDENILEVTNC